LINIDLMGLENCFCYILCYLKLPRQSKTMHQESAYNLRNIGQLVTETAVPPIKGDKFSILF